MSTDFSSANSQPFLAGCSGVNARLVLMPEGQSPQLAAESTPPGGEMRILLICAPQHGLISTLARDGHEVLAADDDAKAVRLLRVFDPQVVLVALPRAAECCMRLRAAVPDAAIVALVASAKADERVKVLDAGADDCLSESFARAELYLRLRAACRRGSRRSAS